MEESRSESPFELVEVKNCVDVDVSQSDSSTPSSFEICSPKSQQTLTSTSPIPFDSDNDAFSDGLDDFHDQIAETREKFQNLKESAFDISKKSKGLIEVFVKLQQVNGTIAQSRGDVDQDSRTIRELLAASRNKLATIMEGLRDRRAQIIAAEA
ncbi:unnamed protein product [Bursaphelenchus xylophilus]|uniref:(pine wood nematode) hypothetical protein n=1 Tax=Bursaphelenchus xylophilus TaxID=6326 RepID=A0A1I7SRY1_BURXY|nr:unnamed protein product [Bursaphelenchus xylophilus]CAG9101720.1 unnamed protein product [Bursaphelenchus xylophilus]